MEGGATTRARKYEEKTMNRIEKIRGREDEGETM